MDVLDGNAIAGELLELFGRDITSVSGSCERCGGQSMVAELVVYARAPGPVARCPHCGTVVMVLVRLPGPTRLSMVDFHLLGGPARPPSSGG
jgi:DNA-directed RNA polymerase subunit RPC12/RpoP